MKQGATWRWAGYFLLWLGPSALAAGRIHRVPEDHPTIQAAVDAAGAGERIVVGKGRFCGATVTKPLDLRGKHGATIIGCPAPIVGPFRVGFFLPDGGASGTSIRGFRFDGRGVSNADLTPLALGVLARDANGVVVERNHFLGTVQAITNTDGSDWRVLFNEIEGLTALTCDGQCAGGDGIVFQQRQHLEVRPRHNLAAFNDVEAHIPDGLSEFSVTGILVLGQEGAWTIGNDLDVPHNPAASAEGVGILVTDQCCAAVVTQTSIDTRVLFNDGRDSEVAVRVSPDANGGPGNLQGAILFGNRGTVILPAGQAAQTATRGAERRATLATHSPSVAY
jgi:hypothetical protein